MLLASFRNIKAIIEEGNSGRWRERENIMRAEQIDQKVIGIVGLGRIGEKVARVFSDLGAKILYTDPSVRNKNYEKVSIEGIFKTAHAVLLSCTTENNYNLVNNDLLSILGFKTYQYCSW